MEAIDRYACDFLNSRFRRLIVISAILVIGLVMVLPLTDEYFALKQQRAQRLAELEETRATASSLERFESRVAETVAHLEKFEARAVSEGRLHEFRSHVVELARQSGCQIRRVHVGEAFARPWRADDDPRDIRVRGTKKDQTSFVLRAQSFTMSVTGTITNLKALLGRLHDEGKLMHTKSLTLRPMGTDRKELTLEVESWLFDLTGKKSVAA
jgi:hypothetical protein